MPKRPRSSSRLTHAVGGIWLLAGVLVGLFVIVSFFSVILPNHAQAVREQTLQAIPTNTTPPSETPVPDTPLPPTPISTALPDTLTPTQTLTSAPTITPTFATFYEGPTVIGYSVQWRPLEVYRFGRGPNAYIVVAGIHGGYEINTAALADQLIAHLATRPWLIPEEATLYILRAMNPDGMIFANQKEGRANANGVDLNRNFPVLWRDTWSKIGCWDYLELNAGPYAASESETIAVMAFILEHPIEALVSYHAAAPGLYPSGKPPHKVSDQLARTLSEASGYPYPAFDPGCQMTGPMVDWVAATGAAALDVELPNHWDTDFDTNLKLVLALVNWLP